MEGEGGRRRNGMPGEDAVGRDRKVRDEIMSFWRLVLGS